MCSCKFCTYRQLVCCLICLHWHLHFPFGVISLGLLKRSLHDTRLTAADLEVRGNVWKHREATKQCEEIIGKNLWMYPTEAATPAAERSPLWHRAVQPLTRAADASGMNLVMMTGVIMRDHVWVRGTMSTIRKFNSASFYNQVDIVPTIHE